MKFHLMHYKKLFICIQIHPINCHASTKAVVFKLGELVHPYECSQCVSEIW